MSSNGILTTYIHSSYFYRVYTFTTAYSSSYVLEAGAGGLDGSSSRATAYGIYSGSYDAPKAFDGNISNNADSWVGASASSGPFGNNNRANQELRFLFPTAKTITKYIIWPRMFHGVNETPTAWQLRGVSSGTTYNPSDSSTYTIISQESNETWTGFITSSRPNTNDITNKTNCNEYLVDNPGSYIQYILHVTDVISSSSYPAIGQMAYYSTMATGNDSFTLSGSVSQKFDIFMIGGGGSGGTTWAGGGGGAGSAVLAKNWSISPDTYNILVGGGGTGITDTTAKGNDGSPTSFGSLFATKGGGGGATGSSSLKIGNDGGSGGGSSNDLAAEQGGASKFETASATIDLDSESGTKYYKNDPTTYNLNSSQNVTIYGNDGGSSVSSSGSSQDFGAGGGGIGAAGSNATTSSGGAGGAGLANDYTYGPASGTTDLKQDGSVLSHPGIQYYGGGGGGGGGY